MSLLFIDSSEHYNSATIGQKYTSVNFASVSTAAGRHGKGIGAPNIWMAFANPLVGHGKFIIGGAVKQHLGSSYFGPNDANETHFYCGSRGDGSLRISVFAGNTYVSEPDVVRNGHWNFVEFEGTIVVTGPVGVSMIRNLYDASLWIDGERVLLVSGFVGAVGGFISDVSEFGWNGIRRGEIGNGTSQDDFYVCDGGGSAPFNARLGDHRIGCIFPNGTGAAAEWIVGSGVGANWELVDEHDAPDNELTYVTASGDGPLDLHEMEDVDTNDTIKAAQMLISGKRSQDGFAFLTPYLRQNGVNYTGRARALPNTYFYRCRDIWEVSPSGIPWTDTIINAIQAGYRRGEY